MTGLEPTYRIMGDRSLLVELGDRIHPDINRRVKALQTALKRRELDGIVEMVPTYRSLMVVLDPLRLSISELKAAVGGLIRQLDETCPDQPKTHRIPVVYGGPYGPDLDWVAGYHGISPEEAIRLHTGHTYHVYMIGFVPGFAYMGELPPALTTPRKETPRTAIARGSVGIAQSQTGVYPVESPGGWQIIGRTPLTLFDPLRWPPTPLEMGDQVRFLAIREEEMEQWQS